MCWILESPRSSGECQDTWSPAHNTFSLWNTYRDRACISSAGQVGGAFSPFSRLRRKVSSNPNPLGWPGPDRLGEGGGREREGGRGRKRERERERERVREGGWEKERERGGGREGERGREGGNKDEREGGWEKG